MNGYKFGLLAASALCVSSLVATTGSAFARDRADVSISIGLGDAAFGYSDGYYNQDRSWHGWQNDEERNWYRETHSSTYYDMGRRQDNDRTRGDWRDGRRSDWRDDSASTDLSVSLGNVEVGYNDGYYDRSRQWHSWNNNGDRDWYQRNRATTYNDMRREDDQDPYHRQLRRGGQSGSVDFSVSLGDVEFGYSDGYYDRSRQWHNWRNDEERSWYRQNRFATYNDMRREDDRDETRRDWRDGRREGWRTGNGPVGFSLVLGRAVIGYTDGYYDDDRSWHGWRSNEERSWYRRNRGRAYYNVPRDRERDRHRRDWRDGRRDDWQGRGERH